MNIKRILATLFVLAAFALQAQAGELHDAAGNGDTVKVRQLLEKGTDVNAKDDKQWTPLHLAASHGHYEIAKLLIEKGADVNTRGNGEMTPLHGAAYWGHTAVAELLIEKGADVNARNYEQWTSLSLAAYCGHTSVAKLLTEKGADINARTDSQWTPLHLAAYYGNTSVAKLLIEKGADVNAKNKDGATPMSIATQKGHTEIAKLFGAASNGHTETAKVPEEVDKFIGEWIVSEYQEGRNKTRAYDGETVSITKRGEVYFVSGPTWFFAEARFGIEKNALIGSIMPDMARLERTWPGVSKSLLNQAHGKIVFKGKLTMLQDGRISAEQNNWEIFFYENTDRFKNATEYPGFYRFVLTRRSP